jgi:hypothetical protein
MKLLRFALALLACACVLVLPPAAGAATTRDGWGLALGDDYWSWGTPGHLPNMEDGFARLRPKAFRFQMGWNAGYLSHHMDRARGLISRARDQGVEQIVVTFREPNATDLAADPIPSNDPAPPAVIYEQAIRLVVQELKGEVDVWGPANEPNLSWLAGTSGGAQKLAAYNQSFTEVVTAWDPTATRTSPDFHDRQNAASLSTYLTAYAAAGGGWGHVLAFHPYFGVNRDLTPGQPGVNPSIASVDDLAGLVPGKDIWITEIGAFGRSTTWGVNDSQLDQQARVNWILGTLANHPRVKRVHYYHGQDHNAAWDTALLNGDLTRRGAWYSWCAAAHGDNASHPDCVLRADRTLFGDVTGDGRADAAAVVWNAGVIVRRSNASAFLPNESWTAGYPFAGNVGTYFADATGDGKADAIAVNNHLGVVVRRSTGSAFSPNEDWTGYPFAGNVGTYFADATGDGKADAIAVNNHLGVVVRRSTGSAFSPNEDWTGYPFAGNVGTYFADATGDGKADAIAVNNHLGVVIRRSTGSSFSPNEDWTGYPFAGNVGTYFADATGDGKADAIAVNNHLGVVVRRSTGNAFLPNEAWTGVPFRGNVGTYVADVTGDGKADIVAVDYNRGIRVRRSTGSSFAPEEDWTGYPFFG